MVKNIELSPGEYLAFDEDELTEWAFDISRKAPAPIDRPRDDGIPKTMGMVLRSVPTGLVVKFSIEDGEDVSLKLNPAVAHHLRLAIMEAGLKMGWMQENGNISFPVLEDK
jgi:hypothetical protein